MQPQRIATVETDLFEHREVKPHFINDCCFGEDFATWLIERLADLSNSGFKLGKAIQEDYGWGFWVTHGKDKFWIALSYVGIGPTETPAQWVVSISNDTTLNVFGKLFRKRDSTAMDTLRVRIRRELESQNGLTIIHDA
jgi:hypothetical protein